MNGGLQKNKQLHFRQRFSDYANTSTKPREPAEGVKSCERHSANGRRHICVDQAESGNTDFVDRIYKQIPHTLFSIFQTIESVQFTKYGPRFFNIYTIYAGRQHGKSELVDSIRKCQL